MHVKEEPRKTILSNDECSAIVVESEKKFQDNSADSKVPEDNRCRVSWLESVCYKLMFEFRINNKFVELDNFFLFLYHMN